MATESTDTAVEVSADRIETVRRMLRGESVAAEFNLLGADN